MVFPAKYRVVIFDGEVDEVLKEVCIEIERRYQVKFLEIGVDKDHVHFLVQSVLTYSVTKIVTMTKSLTGREVFRRYLQVRKRLWGGELWKNDYYASIAGKHGNEEVIGKYVKEQGSRIRSSTVIISCRCSNRREINTPLLAVGIFY